MCCRLPLFSIGVTSSTIVRAIVCVRVCLFILAAIEVEIRRLNDKIRTVRQEQTYQKVRHGIRKVKKVKGGCFMFYADNCSILFSFQQWVSTFNYMKLARPLFCM